MVICSGLSALVGRGETVVLVRRVSNLPSRRTPMTATPPPLSWMARCIWAHESIGAAVEGHEPVSGLDARPSSPGDSGSLEVQGRGVLFSLAAVTAITHADTLWTVVVGIAAPCTMKTTAKSRNASTRLVSTPETMTTAFFHHGSW